jgi:two-component system sensor histidine kinase/response regulator
LRLLRQFDTNHNKDAQKIAALVSADKFDQAQQLAHALKGAAGSLGLKYVQENATALDKTLRSGNVPTGDDELRGLVNSLDVAMKMLGTGLSEIAPQAVPIQGTKTDPAGLKQTIERLEALLARASSESITH